MFIILTGFAKAKNKLSVTGNRTPVSSELHQPMTGGDTYHYTITDLLTYKKYCRKLISSKQYVNRKRNNNFLKEASQT